MPVSYEVDEKIPIEQRQALGKLLETFYSKFPNYVQATDTKIKFAPTARPELKGAFDSNTKKLTVFQDKHKQLSDLLSTTLHELVHAQQLKDKETIGEAAQLNKLYGAKGTPKREKMLKTLSNANKFTYLPSMSTESATELFASTQADYHLRKANEPSKYASQVEFLRMETPELENYIKENLLVP